MTTRCASDCSGPSSPACSRSLAHRVHVSPRAHKSLQCPLRLTKWTDATRPAKRSDLAMSRSARSVINRLNATKRGASLPTPSSCRTCCGVRTEAGKLPTLLGRELTVPGHLLRTAPALPRWPLGSLPPIGWRRPLSNCSAGLTGVCGYPIRYPEGHIPLMLLVKSLILWPAPRDSNS